MLAGEAGLLCRDRTRIEGRGNKTLPAEERATDPGCTPIRTPFDLDREKADYKKRRKNLVEPILHDVRSRIALMAKANGFQFFEAISLDERHLLLAFDDRLNITQQLIHRLNGSSFKPGLIEAIDVPSTRLGLIDVKKLYGSSTGLSGFESITDIDLFCAGGKCAQLYSLLQKFSNEKKFGVIFDSSRELPKEINEIACYDATDEFIKYFNRDSVNLN